MWFESNHFQLSNDKTQNIVFSLSPLDPQFESCYTIKFLSMFFENELSWDSYIDYIISSRSLEDIILH